MKTKEKKVGTIYQTEDYKAFKILKENREVTLNSKLEESIIKDGQLQPGVVENGELLDGQHRLAICKKNKLPFTFIMYDKPLLKRNHIIDLNATAKNWNTENYVRYYAKKGIPQFVKLLKILDKYSEFSLATTADAFNSNIGFSSARAIKAGTYVMNEEMGSAVLDFAKDLGESGMIDENGMSYKSPHFVRAIKQCMFTEKPIKNFDASTFKKKMAHQKKPFLIYGTMTQVLKEFVKLNRKKIVEA